MQRTVLALLLAATTTTLMWFVFAAALSVQPASSTHSRAEMAGIFFLFFICAVFLLGLPTHWLLKRLALSQWWSYVMATCVLSGGALWVLSGFPGPIFAWAFFVGFWLLCVAWAAFGALAFWYVGVRHAPVSAAPQQS